jgi:hypothetical protein
MREVVRTYRHATGTCAMSCCEPRLTDVRHMRSAQWLGDDGFGSRLFMHSVLPEHKLRRTDNEQGARKDQFARNVQRAQKAKVQKSPSSQVTASEPPSGIGCVSSGHCSCGSARKPVFSLSHSASESFWPHACGHMGIE